LLLRATAAATASAGFLTELYSLLPDGCLAVTADTRVGGKQAKTGHAKYKLQRSSLMPLLLLLQGLLQSCIRCCLTAA
jgi:hypothetical protein